MLFEFSVIPIGGSEHLSGVVAEVVKQIEIAGLTYQLTPSATCVEGDWEVVMPVLHECHEIAKRHSSHVVTLIKIEDDAGETNKLARNLRSVEEQAGHPLATQPVSSQPRETGLA
ncbi:MAG: MTH1187 family thiamine-binding protein [Planctomycetaceae bacterium]